MNKNNEKKDVDVDRVFFTLGIEGSGEQLDELDQQVSNDEAENEMKPRNKTSNIGRRRTCYFSLEEAKRAENQQPAANTEQV